VTQLVGDLAFPHVGYLESRRGPIVEIRLSNHPMGQRRTYLRVPDGAGEIPAGVYSTLVKAVLDSDPELGWLIALDLERESEGVPVREDATLDDEWDAGEEELLIASDREAFLPQLPPLEREGGQPVNPFGLWAVDEGGAAFRIDVELDEELGGTTVQPATRYGRSLHPWWYGAITVEGTEVAQEDFDAGAAVLQWQLYEPDGYPDRPYETWRIGHRRAIEAAATHPLPEFDPGEWMRWLTPVDGGDPIAFGGFSFPGDREIELQPVMPIEPEWAAGRVLTIPMPRPGVEFEARREVTVYGKPFKELRSAASKIQKRPPTPLGRFVLEPEGYMPPGWSALG
jgi:hypothetical protein